MPSEPSPWDPRPVLPVQHRQRPLARRPPRPEQVAIRFDLLTGRRSQSRAG